MNGTFMGYITMNKKEFEQSKVFEQVKQGMISRVEAARRLGITTRWIRKKIKRYYDFGNVGLIHRSRGKISPYRWNLEHEKLLIELLQEEWHGFGPTFATEKLYEFYSIKASVETIRQSMIRAHL